MSPNQNEYNEQCDLEVVDFRHVQHILMPSNQGVQ